MRFRIFSSAYARSACSIACRVLALSGLLIGTEMKDALAWSGARQVIAVGSPRLLDNYRIAAQLFGLVFEAHDNSTLLPPALHMIARGAGLMA